MQTYIYGRKKQNEKKNEEFFMTFSLASIKMLEKSTFNTKGEKFKTQTPE